jgi:hypothetical protein
MKELYSTIKMAEEKADIEKWMKIISEVRHEKFFYENVEFRLGQNLLNKQLWTLYIAYLKQKNPARMLEVYSKYCRFFLDDHEMKAKYQEEWQNYGPVKLPWKILFDFEIVDGKKGVIGQDKSYQHEDMEIDEPMEVDIHFQHNEDDKSVYHADSSEDCNYLSDLNDYDKYIYPDEKFVSSEDPNEDDEFAYPVDLKNEFITKLCTHFYDTYKLQNFSLPLHYVKDILENSNDMILRKLFKTCKYFYDKRSTPICYRLEIKSWGDNSYDIEKLKKH